MDNSILVDKDINEGRKLVQILDAKEFDTKAAMWFYFADSNEWKLLIATPIVDEKGPKQAYEIIQKVIQEMQATSKTEVKISLKDIIVLSPTEDPIPLIAMMIRTGPGLSGIRFTKNIVNNKLIDDVYVYRIDI